MNRAFLCLLGLVLAVPAADAETAPAYSLESLLERGVDLRRLENQIAELVSDWNTDLNAALRTAFGETRGRQHAREYGSAFPAGYREFFDASFAADDVASIEQLSAERDLISRGQAAIRYLDYDWRLNDLTTR